MGGGEAVKDIRTGEDWRWLGCGRCGRLEDAGEDTHAHDARTRTHAQTPLPLRYWAAIIVDKWIGAWVGVSGCLLRRGRKRYWDDRWSWLLPPTP